MTTHAELNKAIEREREEARIKELLEVCKKSQGEATPIGHPKTSFCVTYSTNFLYATAEIFYLLGFTQHQGREEVELALLFQAHGIYACKGGLMTSKMLKQLYAERLNNLMSEVVIRYKTAKLCKVEK